MSRPIPLLVLACALLGLTVLGQGPPPASSRPSTAARLAIREVTAFKDGHSFVVQEGRVATNDAGSVVLDNLPAPVLGTFWPYAQAGGKAKLDAVVAGQHRVAVTRTGLQLRELLEANPGAEVFITESPTNRYAATIIGVPERSAAELEANTDGPTGERLPEKSGLIMLRTGEGVKVIALDKIQDVTFRGTPALKGSNFELRNRLELRLSWPGGAREAEAAVGMGYLQLGFRWIPGYHVALDGQGHAAIKLEASLINDLDDLDDATVNLVIGVPSFDAKGMLDPISLQQMMSRMAQQQREESNMFSNAIAANPIGGQIMSQSGGRMRGEVPDEPAPGLEGAKSEDLYYFTVPHVRLRRGERMTVPVAEFTIPYKDVYTLDLPYGPPADFQQQMDWNRRSELARLLAAPKVKHVLRLVNQSAYPLTTAPALVMREGRIQGQGMTTYTSVGGTLDLPVTAAVDIKLRRSDREVGRTPDATTWNNTKFTRIDLEGTIDLTNFKDQAVDVEVTRTVLGTVARVGEGAKFAALDLADNEDAPAMPSWWGWYSWPGWWSHMNGFAKITWTTKIEAGKTATLVYQWHYFWN